MGKLEPKQDAPGSHKDVALESKAQKGRPSLEKYVSKLLELVFEFACCFMAFVDFDVGMRCGRPAPGDKWCSKTTNEVPTVRQ